MTHRAHRFNFISGALVTLLVLLPVGMIDIGQAQRASVDIPLDNVVGRLAWSPDGKILATSSTFMAPPPSQTQLWRADGKLLASLSNAQFLGWSPDSKKVLAIQYNNTSGLADGQLILFDVTGNAIKTLDKSALLADNNPTVAWSPDGKRLAIGCGQVKVWDTVAYNLIATLGQPDIACLFAWSPDSKMLAVPVAGSLTTGSGKGENTQDVYNVQLWDPNGKPLALLKATDVVKNSFSGLMWSPDSKHLAASGDNRTESMENTPRGLFSELWNIATGVSQSFADTVYPFRLGSAWSPDAKWLILLIRDIGDAKTGFVLNEYANGVPPPSTALFYPVATTTSIVTGVSWAPNSKTFALSHGALLIDPSTTDNSVELWSVSGGKAVLVSANLAGMVDPKAFFRDGFQWSPDSTQFAVASPDTPNTVVIYGANGKLKRTLTGSALPLVWSPDGKILATGSDDKTLHLWPMT